ncbi:MAG: carbohydrate ABC transporter permease [Chloroflexi bacterium]|nr:carbohydrate ABC transporter permease [Chloroflexota bacterium]
MATRQARGSDSRAPERTGSLLRRVPLRATQYALLVATALAAIFPIYWMIASSLKSPDELTALPPTWLPAHASIEAYRTVFSVIPYAQAFLNSFVIAAGDTVAIVVTSIMAGYVFAKYSFRGRDILFYAVLATMFVPTIVTLVPLYHVMQSLGLVDSYPGVMLPQLANAFGIFLMRQFIRGVPDELIDAARVDGASEWRVLWTIVTPLLTPAVATLVLFAFVYQWNSFLWPLTILQSDQKFTIVLAMSRLLSYTSSIQFQNVVMAGAVISVLPNTLLFLFLQRFFIAGLAQSGIKG